ncbi:MAG: hypothetical protein V4660_18495 [Pseudomonadota bacterium]
MKNYLLSAFSILLLTLAGCVVNTRGGYAEPCNLHESSPWQVSLGGYDAVINGVGIHLYTRHLYLERTATLIELNAYFRSDGKGHSIKFNEKNAYIESEKRKFYPHPGLTENPFMKSHWHCGGKIRDGSDISHCMGAILTFDKIIHKGDDFVLHLGKILIDDVAIDIPDIEFCYIPEKSGISRFRG